MAVKPDYACVQCCSCQGTSLIKIEMITYEFICTGRCGDIGIQQRPVQVHDPLQHRKDGASRGIVAVVVVGGVVVTCIARPLRNPSLHYANCLPIGQRHGQVHVPGVQ